MTYAQRAFVIAEGFLRNVQIVPIRRSVNVLDMFDSLLIFIAAAFLIAGFVKGVIGLGLPTVSMGLLAVTMPPGQASPSSSCRRSSPISGRLLADPFCATSSGGCGR